MSDGREGSGGVDSFTFEPVTADRWADVAELFGDRGACEGCWCMYWRRPAAEYEAGRGDENRALMHDLVENGREPGILAFDGEQPVAWCSVAPRENYPRLANSRVLAPVDDEPVWSVVCFFVDADYRGRGLTVSLLEAAKRFASERGATILEGYPYEKSERMAPAFAWVGLAAAFERAGFEEVARRSDVRPIMRAELTRPAE